jgi:RNA polymerase sigma factor (sigma-70 family)
MQHSIDDGYGNDLSNGEVVAKYWRWSHAVAGRVSNPYAPAYDDVVQESLIAIWRILEKKGGKANVSATYLTFAARHRMVDVTMGKPMTGGNSRPGPKTEPPQTQSLDVLLDMGGSEQVGFDLEQVLAAADVLEAVSLAYHEGEIVRAIAGLNERDREYVVLRFWGGMTEMEIAARLQVDRKALASRWARTIRPVLHERLSHLVTA